MPHIEMYTKVYCPYCVRAKAFLDKKGIAYEEIPIDVYPERREEMIQRSGRTTVPQIFIDGESIGGCDDLLALHQAGKLDQKLGTTDDLTK